MLQISLYNFKQGDTETFECLSYDIEKGYYKFYISSKEVKYWPSYDWVLDIKHPYEIYEQRNSNTGGDK